MLNKESRFFWAVACLLVAAAPSGAGPAGGDDRGVCTLENECVRLVVDARGRCVQFVDRRNGKNYCPAAGAVPVARIKKAGRYHHASKATFEKDRLMLAFGQTGAAAVIRTTASKHYLTFEVLSVTGSDVEELVFGEVALTLKGTLDDPFVACGMALNLKTNVGPLPGAMRRLGATCYARFGFAGAKMAVIGCPTDQLRPVMQEVVTDAEDLPKSAIGGPWAMGKPINQGSYLFNFDGVSEKTVDQWVRLAKRLGMNQIDFHGGRSFRFGDCRPNPKTYPNGYASLKNVIDRLHAAGIKAGLHTYSFFIAKSCPWVTPVPDRRLAADATFTLAKDLPAAAAAVAVKESTAKMSATTGFFVRNSVTLRIDDELITYTGVSKAPPYTFSGCRRGAWGTKAAPHKAGAKVHHLKECFGLFVPDPQTTLFTEVAAKTAEAYNRCGFDMIYFDALDGEDTLGGRENGWHYGSKFAWEVFKRLKKPPVMEMSTFHHHLWYVRARHGAWDHPRRSHKAFIDIHCRANRANHRMFLPGQLGWWALKTWQGPQGEPTFADDIEYLMGKCLATDTGFALMGINPGNASSIPALDRLADIIRRYEDLRHSGKVPQHIKARLAQPGEELELTGNVKSGWQFRPVRYEKHKVEAGKWSRTWTVKNPFAPQPLRLRIEALTSAGPYDAPGNITLADFHNAADLPARSRAAKVTADLSPSKTTVKSRAVSGCLTANTAGPRRGSWAKFQKTSSPPLNLSRHQAMGVWVHGDGSGAVLNFQLRSPTHISHAYGDHYVIADFTGWRYFELIEPEGHRHARYGWPYGGIYSIYRESVRYHQVADFAIWCNHLPPGKKVTCCLSAVRALPTIKTRLKNPSITVGGKTLVFPVSIDTGCYLELHSPSDCKLYDPKGAVLSTVRPQGAIPTLTAGDNRIEFHCDSPSGISTRANVTVMLRGAPLTSDP